MAGFRRDINTSVQTPQVQVPKATGDDVSDVLNIATFGLGLYSQYKEKQATQKKAERQDLLLGKAQDIHLNIVAAMEQKDLSPERIEMMVQKGIRGVTSSPTERQFLIESIGKLQSSDLFKESLAGEVDEDTQLTDLLRNAETSTPGIVQGILGEKDISELSTEEKRRANVEVRKRQADLNKLEALQEDLSMSPSVNGFARLSQEKVKFALDQAGVVLPSLMDKVRRAGGDSEQVELLSAAKSNLVAYIEQVKQNQALDFNNAFASVSKDEAERIKGIHDNTMKALDSQIKSLNDMDEEQFLSTARLAKKLKDELSIELHKSLPQAMRIKEALGPAYNALMDVVLSKQPELLEKASQTVEGSLLEVLSETVSGRAVTAQFMDLSQIAPIVEGQPLADVPRVDREAIASSRWSTVSPIINDVKTIDSMNDAQVKNVAKSMIDILDLAEEVGDEQSLKNASKMLSSKAVSRLLEHNALDDLDKKTFSNYIASSSIALIKDRANEGVEYDVSSGKFTAKSDLPKENDRSGITAGVRTSVREAAGRKESMLNERFDAAAEALAKYNPAISNTKEAKDYMAVLLQGSVKLKGVLPAIEQEKIQAAQEGITVQELKQRSSLEEEVRAFSEGTSEALEGEKLRVQGKQVQEEAIDQESALRLRVKAFKKRFPEEAKFLSDEEIAEELTGG